MVEAGVTVNAVGPTFIYTPGTAERLDNPEYRANVLARIPANKIGDISDVAGCGHLPGFGRRQARHRYLSVGRRRLDGRSNYGPAPGRQHGRIALGLRPAGEIAKHKYSTSVIGAFQPFCG